MGLANLAHFVTVLDPLIEEGILVFAQAPVYPVAYDADDLRRLASVPEIIDTVTQLDPSGKELAAWASEMMLDQPQGSMKFGPERYAMHALNGILAGMAAGSASGGGWDLDVPQHAMEPAVDHLVRQATAAGKHARMLRGCFRSNCPRSRDTSRHTILSPSGGTRRSSRTGATNCERRCGH